MNFQSFQVNAAERLDKQGMSVVVVSMPCWELFDTQSESYRDEVLGSAPRIAIEAAAKFGWTRYVASEADVIGMDGFGASGPADQLYGHFGISEEAIVTRAIELVRGQKENEVQQ